MSDSERKIRRVRSVMLESCLKLALQELKDKHADCPSEYVKEMLERAILLMEMADKLRYEREEAEEFEASYLLVCAAHRVLKHKTPYTFEGIDALRGQLSLFRIAVQSPY